MKKLLTILGILICYFSEGQTPNVPTPPAINYTPMTAAGYRFKYVVIDSGLNIPFRNLTTGRGIVRPGTIVVNTVDSFFYGFNGANWLPFGTGTGTISADKVDSVTISGNNLFYWIGSVGTGTQINKIDSVKQKAGTDSIFTYIGGVATFVYRNIAAAGAVSNVTSSNNFLAVATGTTTPVLTIDTVKLHSFAYLQTQFAARIHVHSAADITSGTLTTTRGGTGLSGIGSVAQQIRVTSDGLALEYFTPVPGQDAVDSLWVFTIDTLAWSKNGFTYYIPYEIINPISTYAGLRAMTTTPWDNVVYKTTDDGVDFIWNAVSTATDDGYTVLKVDALTTGRFIKTDQELLPVADGLFSPGNVSWTGTGLIFDISPSIFFKNGTRYETPASTVTLDAADPSLPRIDAFVVDTIPATDKITGTAATNPLTPQEDPASQIILAEILINAGDLTPSNILVNKIYDEDIEWTTSTTGTITADFDNTTHPFVGSKEIYVSAYNNNSKLLFTYSSTETVDAGAVLKLHIYTNGIFQNRLRFQFFNTSNSSGGSLTFNSGNGFNPNLTGTYQAVSIPLSAFHFTSGTYNRLVITMVGNGPTSGIYFDNIHIQSGITNLPPQTDYSNKLDSVTITKTTVGADTTNVFKTYVKGIAKTIGTLWTGGTAGGGSARFGVSGEDDAAGENRHFGLGATREFMLERSGGQVSYFNMTPTYHDWYLEYGTSGAFAEISSQVGASPGLVMSSIEAQDTDHAVVQTTGEGDVNILSQRDLNFLDFGTGAKTGTPAYNLAVTATGKVIEVAGVGGGDLSSSDTAAMLSPYLKKVNITAGTNVNLTGSGTDASPYVINSLDETSAFQGAAFQPTEATITATITKPTATYNFPAFIDWLPNGELVCVYSDGAHDGGGENVDAILIKSLDQGQTWPVGLRTTIQSTTADTTLMVCGGGIGLEGRMLIFTALTDTTNGLIYYSMNVRYSDDQQTWSARIPISPGANDVFLPYGQLVKIAGDTLMLSWYGHIGSTYSSYVIKSGDNGLTWGSSIVAYTSGSVQVTETSFTYLGGNVVLGVGRTENGNGMVQVISYDNGSTWATQGITGLGVLGYNLDMGALTTVISPTGESLVEFVYCTRSDGALNAIYARVQDIISLGTSAWNASSKTVLAITGNGTPSFYPVVAHHQGALAGIVAYTYFASGTNAYMKFSRVVATGTIGLNVSVTGANLTATQYTYGGFFSNTRTGTTSVNTALYATATGGTTNYAGIFHNGNVGIGITTPTYKLDVTGNSRITNGLSLGTATSGSGGAIVGASTGDLGWVINSVDNNSPYLSFQKAGGAKWAVLAERNTPVWGGVSNDMIFYNYTAGIANLIIRATGALGVPTTITAAATTGAQTINKMSGRVNFAAAASSLVVTNSLVTASSLVFCQIMSNDSAATSTQVVAGAGSFTIFLNAPANAETKVAFWVIN